MCTFDINTSWITRTCDGNTREFSVTGARPSWSLHYGLGNNGHGTMASQFLQDYLRLKTSEDWLKSLVSPRLHPTPFEFVCVHNSAHGVNMLHESLAVFLEVLQRVEHAHCFIHWTPQRLVIHQLVPHNSGPWKRVCFSTIRNPGSSFSMSQNFTGEVWAQLFEHIFFTTNEWTMYIYIFINVVQGKGWRNVQK